MSFPHAKHIQCWVICQVCSVFLYMDERTPWERMKGEPAFWYARFVEYRDMGPARSFTRYFRGLTPTQIRGANGASNHLWSKHAKQWNWKERAEAWDEYNEESERINAYFVLSHGLALAHERIKKLEALADRLESILMNKDIKLSPFLIEQYRGLLKDIAEEKGERTKETRLTGVGGGPIVIETSWGRGGSASAAWEQLPAPKVIVEEIQEVKNED